MKIQYHGNTPAKAYAIGAGNPSSSLGYEANLCTSPTEERIDHRGSSFLSLCSILINISNKGIEMNDLRKFINITKRLYEDDGERRDQSSLLGAPEGHALGHGRKEGLDYIEKKVKKVVDRVTLELAGSKAGVFTKLGRRYELLNLALKRLQGKQETMNIQLKDRMVEFFDAEDEVLTRVLKTAKITLTLGKMEFRTPSAKFDANKFLVEIYNLAEEVSKAVPELTARIQELEAKYTSIGEPKEVSPKLLIKTHTDESLTESFDSDWDEFDANLADIKKRMEQLI